jgi:NADH:ubiquinone oxidoreductase subunit B-like Fe-S oxidoreductase
MRKNSLWPMPMGLACCAIELMADGVGSFRHRPFWRRGDAFLAAAM